MFARLSQVGGFQTRPDNSPIIFAPFARLQFLRIRSGQALRLISESESFPLGSLFTMVERFPSLRKLSRGVGQRRAISRSPLQIQFLFANFAFFAANLSE